MSTRNTTPNLPPTTLANLDYTIWQSVVEHLDRPDLLRLQRVSNHFHRLASERLYGVLQFKLFSSLPETKREPAGLFFTDALETISSSDYDYGQHVRAFIVEGHSAPEPHRLLALRYRYEDTPCKLLNTLLRLVLRKTKGLITFRWCVPVELSPAVYAVLGKIGTLQDLAISLDTILVLKSPPNAGSAPPPPPPPGGNTLVNAMAAGFVPPSHPAMTLATHGASNLPSSAKVRVTAEPSRQLSTFTRMRAIELRGIDDFACVPEIAALIRKSGPTLKKLSLSLSSYLVKRIKSGNSQAGQPAGPLIVDDDALTEDYLTPPPVDNSQIISATDKKKLKNLEMTFLAQIFGLEPTTAVDKKVDRFLKAKASSTKRISDKDIRMLTNYKAALANGDVKLSDDMSKDGRTVQAHIAGLVTKAVDHYLASQNSKSSVAKAKAPTNKKCQSAKTSDSPPYPQASMFPSSSSSPHMVLSSNGAMLPPLPVPGTSGSFDMGSNGNAGPSSWSTNNFATSSKSFSLMQKALGLYEPLGVMKPSLGKLPDALEKTVSSLIADHIHASAWPGGVPHLHPPVLSGFLGQSSTSWKNSQLGPKSPLSPATSIQSLSKPGSAHVDNDSSDSEGAVPDECTAQTTTNDQTFVDELDEEDSTNLGVDMEHPDTISDDVSVDERVSDEDEATIDTGDEESSNKHSMAKGKMIEKGKDKIVTISGSSPTHAGDSASSLGSSESLLDKTDSRPRGGAGHPPPPFHKTVPQKPQLLERRTGSLTNDQEDSKMDETMRDYLRQFHGHSLEELTLYLVPVKPSVLARALDFSSLKSISLLSVGPQGALWTLMSKQRSEGVTFNLKSVQTDDVSMAFLHFIAELPDLHELYLLQRSNKDFDRTTEKTPASLDEIRQTVIYKHARTLRRLSIINNDVSGGWDLDKKCIRLLASLGVQLKEFAFGISADSFHEFVKHLPDFNSLAAVHLSKLPNSPSAYHNARELRRQIMDIMYLVPSIKLRLLGIQNGVHSQLFAIKVESPAQAIHHRQRVSSLVANLKQQEHVDFSAIEEAPRRLSISSYPRFVDVEDEYRIFSQIVRTGRP